MEYGKWEKPNVISFDYWMLSILNKIFGQMRTKILSRYKPDFRDKVLKMSLAELKESGFRWSEHEVLLAKIFEDAHYKTDNEIQKALKNSEHTQKTTE